MWESPLQLFQSLLSAVVLCTILSLEQGPNPEVVGDRAEALPRGAILLMNKALMSAALSPLTTSCTCLSGLDTVSPGYEIHFIYVWWRIGFSAKI